jgi:hypothetical protein
MSEDPEIAIRAFVAIKSIDKKVTSTPAIASPLASDGQTGLWQLESNNCFDFQVDG